MLSVAIDLAGRYRTIALTVAHGLLGTPRARDARETVRAWFDLLRKFDASRINDIRSAWPIAGQFI